jgi:steroid delta-isomerase
MSTPTADAIRSTVRSYTERHTAGDIDGIVALFTADAHVEDPVGGDAHVGTEQVRGFFASTHELCDKLELELTGPVRVAGGRAAFPMIARTHIGDLTMEIDIIDVMVFDDDARISEMYAYWDMSEARTLA